MKTGAGWYPKFRRRVPELIQTEATECGAASLAMILNYYGCKVSVSEVRMRCQVGRNGLSALSLVQAARNYGLRARGVTLQNTGLKHVPLPAIVHWEFNHFMVVEGWKRGYVQVVDPAYGRRRLSAAEFDAGFTGVLILLEPGVQFERRPAQRRVSLLDYLKHVLQARGVVAQVLAASLLLQALGLGLPLLTQALVDRVIPLQLSDVMPVIGAGIALLTLTQLVVALLRSSLLIYLQARVDSQIMLGFFEHLLALPYRFFQQRSTGDLLARLNSNAIIRETLTGQLLSVILDSGLVVIYLAVLFWQSVSFGGLVLGLGLVQVLLLAGSARRIRDLNSRDLAAQGKAQGYLSEALVGVATLKSAGAEQRAFNHWSNLYFEQLNVSTRRNYLTAVLETALTALRGFSPLALLWFGTVQVLNGSLSVGNMLALNSLALSFLGPLASLVGSGQQLQLVRAHFERITDVIATEPEQDITAVQPPPRLSGEITLEQVSFRYDANSPQVLRDINLRITPGQKVAIVGRTGSGKSTLARLLLGLYLPSEGEIRYDNLPLGRLNYQAVRNQFGIVLQEAFVFSGTIRQNLVLNNPELELERVVEAARLAALHNDIMQMPMGYETFVSEGGSALSGGQRQRLSLARAIAHRPAILLLDEATSQLDVLTEQMVEQNLNSLDCTRIVIAHRLSTVRNAGLILVLDQGTIVEQGTHQQLLARNGYYAALIQSQLEDSLAEAA